METVKKGFGSKIGFILAAVGSAVGLGNIWRFPFLVGKFGGGAFVIVYLLAVLLLGSVIMIAETYLGKRAQTNIVNSYGKVNKWLKWIGLLGVIIPFIISSYYAVIGGWATGFGIEYIFRGITITDGDAVPHPTLGNGITADTFGEFISDPVISTLFFILFFAIALFIVCGGVQKGIEKAGKIMMPLLFVILVVIVICSCTLPGLGAGSEPIDGLKFYLGQFNFEALGWKGAIAAMGQAFYSLSLGMGVMVAYGSYTGKGVNLGKSALQICFFDTLVALLAGLAIFPGMFATGNASDVILSGPKLMFIALPKIFLAIPGGYILGFLFYILVFFAAITSLISLIEVVSQYTIDKYQWSRNKATLVFGGAIGLLGIFVAISYAYDFRIFGFELLDYLDLVTNTVLMPLVALGACVAVGYFIGPKKVFKELEEMGTKFKGQKLWMGMTMSITPILIAIVWIMGIIDNFDAFANPDAQHPVLNFGFVLVGAAALLLFTIIWNVVINNKKFQVKMYKKDPQAAAVIIGDPEVMEELKATVTLDTQEDVEIACECETKSEDCGCEAKACECEVKENEATCECKTEKEDEEK